MSLSHPIPWVLWVGGAAVLWGLLSGAKQGLARQIVSLLALGVAIMAGYAPIEIGLKIVRLFATLPDLLLEPLARITVAVTIYCVALWIGKLMTPTTQSWPTFGGRLFSALGGGIIGGLVSLIVVWAVFQGLRGLDRVGEDLLPGGVLFIKAKWGIFSLRQIPSLRMSVIFRRG